jgi:hypothetical protein
MLYRLPLNVLYGRNFWLDICRSRKGIAFFYLSTNTAAAESTAIEGLQEHKGEFNKEMNDTILSLFKEPPFAALAMNKDFMIANGAGVLYNMKGKIIQALAQNIVR